ncbi:hypothetical protein PHYC_01981 [Phycisphaerales bacterium]|nr:hypothetical protein PHYC_01981 [Phycisphaerales bacterium]
MRTMLAFLAPLSLAAFAHADVFLYSNGNPSPFVPALGASPSALNGAPAPGGFSWSEAPLEGAFCNSTAGVSSHFVSNAGDFRITDDVTIPAGGWTLDSILFYAYQPGASGPGSPFTRATLRIWSGAPGDPGSFVIWGDATTNRLISSQSTGIYRIFNSITQPLPPSPDTSRLLWVTRVNIGGLYLAEGTVWFDWQYSCANPDRGAYSPTVTNPGRRGVGNARQFRQAYGTFSGGWVPVRDQGKAPQAPDLQQDFPFLLFGTAGASCDPDVNCDGGVNGFDIEVMEQAVNGDFSNFCQADPDFNHDGAVNGFDIEAVEQSVNGAPCP